jgi:hypothetical protein
MFMLISSTTIDRVMHMQAEGSLPARVSGLTFHHAFSIAQAWREESAHSTTNNGFAKAQGARGGAPRCCWDGANSCGSRGRLASEGIHGGVGVCCGCAWSGAGCSKSWLWS